MNSPEAQAILEPAATRVRDPASGKSLWLAGLLRDARVEGDRLEFTLAFGPTHSEDDQGRMTEALRRNLDAIGWKGEVRIHKTVSRTAPQPGAGGAAAPTATAAHDHGHDHAHAPKKEAVRGMSGPGMQPHGGPIDKKAIPGVRHIVAVASGKGGVGKSTVACNLAVALARRGLRIGLMDADIYGPSLPTMMKVKDRPFAGADKKIIPLESHGVKCMSIGFLVADDEPIIWRGPMVMGVVKQFLQDVAWGELDVLIVDLPPGTGDAQLTMIQAVPLAGAVIVTTPQDVAVLDAVRGVEMFRKLEVPVLGVVENMAWFDLPDGTRTHPFGTGGGRRTAARYGVPLLSEVPLDSAIRESGDAGQPVALTDEGSGPCFHQIGAEIAAVLELA
jgi:ATP-binding protein involved in chromosome partitioning